MGKDVKISAIVTQCRMILGSMSVVGPHNARILAAVYDDLEIVEQYLLGEDKERERRKADDTKEDNQCDL